MQILLALSVMLISGLGNEENKLHFKAWFGHGPNCPKLPDLCDRLNLGLVETSRLGHLKDVPCTHGTKHLCKIKGIERVPSPEVDKTRNHDFDLKVVNVNLNQTKRRHKYWENVVAYDGYLEKSCRLPEWLKDNYDSADVFILSGYTLPGCTDRISLETKLAFYGWPFVNHKFSADFMENRFGISLFTKLRMTPTYFQGFSSLRKGRNAFKYGFEMSGFYHHRSIVTVFLIKLDPKDHDVRMDQLEEVRSKLESMQVKETDVILVYSNFKVDFFFNEKEKLIAKISKHPEEYVGHVSGFRKPKDVHLEKVRVGADKPFKYCPKIREEKSISYDFKLDCGKDDVTVKNLTDIPARVVNFSF